MTDIKSTLDNLDAELASLNTRLSTATALGSKEAAVGAATRVASAAIQSLRDRVKAASDLITDRYGPQVTEALGARKLALTAADTASTQGNPPPLADAQEAALKKTVLNANGVPDASVDAQAAAAVAAITKVDTDIAALGTDAKGTLKKKQDDLVTAQNALAVAREAALAVLAKIVGSGADLRAKLNAAVAHRLDAQNLAAAADKVSHLLRSSLMPPMRLTAQR